MLLNYVEYVLDARGKYVSTNVSSLACNHASQRKIRMHCAKRSDLEIVAQVMENLTLCNG